MPEVFLTLSELERNGILAKHSAESGKSMRVLEKDVWVWDTPQSPKRSGCLLPNYGARSAREAFFDLRRFHRDGHDSLIPILRC